MMADVVITGLGELKAMFQTLPKQLAEAGLRRAAYTGAAIIQESAKANVHNVTGTLSDAIIVKRIEEKSGPFVQTYYVTVRKGKFGGPDGYYGQWVEFGHLIRTKGQSIKGGRRSSKNQRVELKRIGAPEVPAHPYMRPAVDAHGKEATDAIKEALITRIRELTNDH
jgi:HK97 gp10 family phage protein